MRKSWAARCVAVVSLAAAGCGAGADNVETAEQSSALDFQDRLLKRWIRTADGTGETDVQADRVVIDATGRRTVAFHYSGNASLSGGGSLPITQPGSDGLTVVGYDAQGTAQWGKVLAISSNPRPSFPIVYAMTTDSSGNILLGGHIGPDNDGNTFTFGTGGPGCRNVTNGAFLVKLQAGTGECMWARNTRPAPGRPFDFVDFAPTTTGGFVALARFAGPIAPVAYYPMMLIAYDAQGQSLWTKTFDQPQSATNGIQGQAVAVDAFNRPYVAGFWVGNVTLGGQLFSAPPGKGAPYLAAFEANGDFRFLRRPASEGGATSVSVLDGHLAVGAGYGNKGHLLSYDLSGALRFDRTVGDGAPTATQLGPFKEITVLTPVRDPEGNRNWTHLATQWDRVTGTLLGQRFFDLSQGGNFSSLEVDPTDGSVTLGGGWHGTADFGPGIGTQIAQGDAAGFVVTLNR